MEDFRTLVLSLPRIPSSLRIGTCHGGLKDFGSELTKNTPPSRIGTSHGRLRNFGSELTKNTPLPELELIMEDLGTLVLSLPRRSELG